MVGGPCGGETGDLNDKAHNLNERSHLIFDDLCLTPRAMTASGLTAIATFQVISLGKNQIRSVHVIIDTFSQRTGFRLWEAAHSWILPTVVTMRNLGNPMPVPVWKRNWIGHSE